jgi:hypothetical protein
MPMTGICQLLSETNRILSRCLWRHFLIHRMFTNGSRNTTGQYNLMVNSAHSNRYTHYHANDLSSQTLGEEKDLQVYVRAARLAEGEDIDRLLGSNEGIAWSAQGNEDITTANAQFYESWLKA